MNQVSVVMIVADEDQFITECLTRSRDLADQFVIVDLSVVKLKKLISGILNKNDILVEADNRELYKHGFAHMRNFASSRASHEWLIHLDADEFVETDAQQVRDQLQATVSDVANVKRINILKKNNLSSSEARAAGSVHEEIHARIFRRGTDAIFKGFIHEELFLQNKHARALATPPILQISHYSQFRNVDPNLKQHKYDWMLLKCAVNKELQDGISRWYFEEDIPGRIDHVIKSAKLFSDANQVEDLTEAAVSQFLAKRT